MDGSVHGIDSPIEALGWLDEQQQQLLDMQETQPDSCLSELYPPSGGDANGLSQLVASGPPNMESPLVSVASSSSAHSVQPSPPSVQSSPPSLQSSPPAMPVTADPHGDEKSKGAKHEAQR